MLDLPVFGVRDSLSEKRRHMIFLADPHSLQDQTLLTALAREGELVLIVSPDELLDFASSITARADFVLPATSLGKLSQKLLLSHWQKLDEHWSASWPAGATRDARPPRWSPEIPTDGSTLSLHRILKILGVDGVSGGKWSRESFSGADEVHRWHVLVNAMAELEDRELGVDATEAQFREAVAETQQQLRLPLTLSLPGVAPRYQRLIREFVTKGSKEEQAEATGQILKESPNARHVATASDPLDPPEVLNLMVAHNAAGDNSMGVVLTEPVPDAAFVALADLERHWIHGARPKKEERLRARLDETMKSFWTDSMVASIGMASQIDAFTNFPIGLLRMPGHTAPLAALLPIAYRPINPLTRALQLEFSSDRVVDLSKGMRVLVVECIPDTDPVGIASRNAWAFVAERLNDPDRSVFVDLASVANKEELATSVAAHQPDVLIVSAHGVYDADSNMAGLKIGAEVSVGDDLGRMPPLVILSACHSGPRGAGPVSVSDLLLRAGADSVLSTLIPVDVHHNSVFMMRFLIYMSEVIAGNEPHKNLLDIWHRVQTSSVITDIIYGNQKLKEWGHSSKNGTSPIVEFMKYRSKGRLRPWHLYQDAETVLLEIAADRGEEASVRGWLRAPGFTPESMMYTIVGDPSCIRLQSPTRLRAKSSEFE